MKSSVDHYEKVLHVLMYLANSNQPRSNKDIEDLVLDINICNIRRLMQQLCAKGYVIDYANGKGTKHRYVASKRTIELYGDPSKYIEPPTVQPKYIDRGLGTEKLCNLCKEYFPCTDDYFYRNPPSHKSAIGTNHEGSCKTCSNLRKAQYRAKQKEIKYEKDLL